LLGLPGTAALLLCAMLLPARAAAQDAFARIGPPAAGYSAEAAPGCQIVPSRRRR